MQSISDYQQSEQPDTTRATTGCSRTRSFIDDRRGVSAVVGAILMFGLLMLVLVLIQTNVVPVQNQQVEFEHNQRVQQDMQAFDQALLEAATDNVPDSAQVELSARYPSRFFLINPSEGSGSLESVGGGTVTVSNARAASAPAYWDGTDRRFETTLVRYRPSYNEYRNAPQTVYEHNTLVNRFDGGAVTSLGSGSFVRGDQVTLLLVDGDISVASESAVAIEARPLSAPIRTTTITGDGTGDITISLPTTLTDEQWESILADELASNGGNVADVTVAPDPTGAQNVLTVTLLPGEYDLRIGRVGIDNSIDDSVLGPYYLTPVTEASSIRNGETRAVTAQIRDRYNNPTVGSVTYSATTGTFRLPDGSQGTTVTVESDEDGVVSAVYVPPPTFEGTATVTVEQDFDGSGSVEPRERTTVDIVVSGFDSTFSADDPNGVASVNPGTPGSVRLNGISRSSNTVTMELENTGSTDQRIERMRLSFYLSNPAGGSNIDHGDVAGNDYDRIELYGDWDNIDETIVIGAGDTYSLDIVFSPRVTSGDFFGVSVEYDGSFANYYVQVDA